MDKLNVLIVDPSEDFRKALSDALQGIYTVRTAADGLQALQMLPSFLPRILVLDLLLPGLDGISLLQKVFESGHHPSVLVVTRHSSQYALETTTRMGVDYFILKPCDIGGLVARIADLAGHCPEPVLTQPKPKTQVSGVLLRLGIPTKLRGYSYLREAVLLMADDPNQSITKELYPAVAKIFDANALQVERSIRSAVHTAWQRRDEPLWRMYFSPDETGLVPRPTNAAFISRLADLLLLEEDALPEE